MIQFLNNMIMSDSFYSAIRSDWLENREERGVKKLREAKLLKFWIVILAERIRFSPRAKWRQFGFTFAAKGEK